MNSIDLEKMTEVHNRLFVTDAKKSYGGEGVKCLRQLLRELKDIYRFITPEKIERPLIVFKSIQKGCTPSDLDDNFVEINQTQSLVNKFDYSAEQKSVIQLCGNQNLKLWNNATFDLQEFSRSLTGIVYCIDNENEHFLFKGDRKEVTKLVQGVASMFSVPTFRSLEMALDTYANQIVRYSSCKILDEIWADAQRIYLVNEPESKIRDSLTQYLRCTLRDVTEVRPEQNTDETKPVDIKVTWSMATRLALIEIKWLGDSKTTKFRDKRARDGVTQLADYLDRNKQHAPNRDSMGYIVIVDARRRKAEALSNSFDKQFAFWYQEQEIEFDAVSEYLNRDDIHEPLRMFAEPKCHTI